MKTRLIPGLFLLVMIASLGFATLAARPADIDQPLKLPAPVSEKLQVPPGNELSFHWYTDLDAETFNSAVVVPPAAMFADPLRTCLRCILIASLQPDTLIQIMRREK